MLAPIYTKQFDRDLQRLLKRGKEVEKFKTIARMLLAEESLPSRYRDHKLSGAFVGRRDCHVENDWVLIYKKETTAIVFERTGTHSDLFE
jgi:mRNA interferase YafQ